MPQTAIMTMVFGQELADGRLTDIHMLEALSAMGYDGVELPTSRLFDNAGCLADYRAVLADAPLEVPCLDAVVNLVHRDATARQHAVDDLRRGIDAAAQLDAPLALVAGSRLSDGITPDEGRRMIAEGLSACTEHANAAGVTLAIEDFGVAPTLQCAANDCAAVLDGAPGTALVFDTGNFYFAGEDPLDNFERLAPRTRHVHVKDWRRSAKPEIADVAGVALGKGLIPNAALIKRFLAETDVPWFSVELGAPGARLEAARNDLHTLGTWLNA